jgi:hypothetical protein
LRASGSRTLASARRRIRGSQSLTASHANARQPDRSEPVAHCLSPTA